MSINPQILKSFVNDEIDKNVLPSFKTYLTIPCTSPAYDVNWFKNQQLRKAAILLRDYAKNLNIPGLDAVLSTDEDKTPFLLITIDASPGEIKSILFYGHLDKSPGGEGWSEGLGPYTPVVQNDFIYGRGAADNGWAFYSVLTIIRAIKNQKMPHPRFVMIIEGSEESGSVDLPFYLENYIDIIGKPSLVVTLDSEIFDYSRIWLTSSIRGQILFDLKVTTLLRGIHSGKFSGIAPESFMIVRSILSRLENYDDPYISLKQFEVDIPQNVREAAENTVLLVGETFIKKIPLLPGVGLIGDGNEGKLTTDLFLNNTWKPALTVIGIQGIPAIKDAGNVLRPFTNIRISIRTPPSYDAVKNGKTILTNSLVNNPPFNCNILLENFFIENGLVINPPMSELNTSLNSASTNYLLSESAQISTGISIPFVYIISRYFPNAQYIVTGCAGMDSNQHASNERLNLSYLKNFTCTMSHLIADYKNFLKNSD